MLPRGPACLTFRLGLGILCFDWIVLTLASGLVLVLVPDRWLRRVHAGCVALHIVGLGAFATWFGAQCLH